MTPLENVPVNESLDCMIAAGNVIRQQWARFGSKTDGTYSPFALINDWEGWRDDAKTKVAILLHENKELITAVWSLLDAGKFAQWPDDVAEANWGISAMAARELMNETRYAKSINDPQQESPNARH